MPTFQHAIGQGRASCEGGSLLFRSKTKAMAEMMCAWRTRGRSLQKHRSNCRPVRCCRGDGTVRAREGGEISDPLRRYLPHEARRGPPQNLVGGLGKIRLPNWTISPSTGSAPLGRTS